MSIEITVIVLLAAGLHAGWNTLIKIGGDRVAVMAFVTLAGSLISLFFLPFVEDPAPASWPLLAATVLLHTGYHFFLAVAYDYGDLRQVYPMAWGSAPLLVTLAAFLFAEEVLQPVAIISVLCLAIGVMALTFDKAAGITKKPKAVCFALATGTCIASYTVVDGLGVRQAGSVLGFAIWLTIGDGLLTFVIALIWKGGAICHVVRSNVATGVVGGAMQVGAYWIIMWALALAPMGLVLGFRETSVLFAALISTFVLKEGLGAWRFISAVLVSLGLMLQRMHK